MLQLYTSFYQKAIALDEALKDAGMADAVQSEPGKKVKPGRTPLRQAARNLNGHMNSALHSAARQTKRRGGGVIMC